MSESTGTSRSTETTEGTEMTESTPEDRQEQRTTLTGDAARYDAPDVPLEAPAADVVEQSLVDGPDQHVADSGGDAGRLPLEAEPADAAEQSVVVELDEDERR